MTTTLKLKLRHDPMDGTEAPYDEVDLDRLSPRARALAEACAQNDLSHAGTVWCERGTVADLIPDAARWHAPADLAGPVRVPWSGWSVYPIDSTMDPHAYLEQQARRIHPDYTIVGNHPHNPAPSRDTSAADQLWTRAQVIDYLRAQGRSITPDTWSAYVARGQAPAPARRIGRTPLWAPAEIKAYVS